MFFYLGRVFVHGILLNPQDSQNEFATLLPAHEQKGMAKAPVINTTQPSQPMAAIWNSMASVAQAAILLIAAVFSSIWCRGSAETGHGSGARAAGGDSF